MTTKIPTAIKKFSYAAAISVGVLALAFGLLAEWLRSFDRGVVSPLVATNQAPLSGIAEISSNRAWAEDPVRLRVTLLNRSTSSVKDIRVVLIQHPGIELRTPLSAVNATLSDNLGPGEKTEAPIMLAGIRTSGQYTMTLRYEWRESKEEKLDEAVIVLGPLVFASPLWSTIARIGAPLIALFKDLALPVVLAVGAWLLQKHEKTRDTEKKAADEKRDAAKKEADDARANQQTTWNLMLPVSHQFNTKYYLPILRAVNHLDRVAKEGEKARDVLYDFMAVCRLMRYLTTSIGGLFLKETKAEELVVGSWALFYHQTQAKLDRIAWDAVVEAMKPREGRAAFSARFTQPTPELLSLETGFSGWYAATFVREALPPLRLFHDALLHEANRPFTNWYEGPLDFPKAELEKSGEDLAALVLPPNEAADPALARHERWRLGIPAVMQKLRLYIELRTPKQETPS